MMPKNSSEILARRITERLSDKIQSEIWTPSSPTRPFNYMSQSGEPCRRRLYYERTAQNKKLPPAPAQMKRMLKGRAEEEAVKIELGKVGFSWVSSQQGLFVDDLLLTGKIDGRVADTTSDKLGALIAEVKSVERWAFDSVRTPADLRADQWLSYGYYQLQSYIKAADEREGLLILRNKSDGDIKPIPVELNDDAWTEIAAKFEAVNRAVEREEPPPRIEENRCTWCPFRPHCAPDLLPSDELAIIDDPEAEALLDEMESLKPSARRYEELCRWRRERFKGTKNALVRSWLVTGTERSRKAYSVPASNYWHLKFEKLEIEQA